MLTRISFKSRIMAMVTKFITVQVLLYLLTIRYLLFDLLGPYYATVIILIKFIAFILALDILNDLLKYFYRRRIGLGQSQHDNITLGLNNIYLLLVIGAVAITVTSFFGLNPKELFTSLSIVAAALAIISKEYISDIIGGMYIAFSREVAIDDLIRIGEHTGKIQDIGISKTALIDDDDDLIYVPNHKFIMEEVTNYSRSPVRTMSVEFEVELHRLTTLDDLEKAITHALSPFREYFEPGSSNLKVVHVYKDYLHLKFQYILHVRDRAMEKEIRRKTVRRVVDFIREHGHRTPGPGTGQ